MKPQDGDGVRHNHHPLPHHSPMQCCCFSETPLFRSTCLSLVLGMLQEVIWRSARDHGLASAWAWVELQARKGKVSQMDSAGVEGKIRTTYTSNVHQSP